MRNIFVILGFFSICLTGAMAFKPNDINDSSFANEQGLKDYFHHDFLMGVAVNAYSIKGPDSSLIIREFNSLTPENDMKMGPIHPEETVTTGRMPMPL